MFGLPPATVLLLSIHTAVGATCLGFGLTLKRSFRWVLLLVAGAEAVGLGIAAWGFIAAP